MNVILPLVSEEFIHTHTEDIRLSQYIFSESGRERYTVFILGCTDHRCSNGTSTVQITDVHIACVQISA